MSVKMWYQNEEHICPFGFSEHANNCSRPKREASTNAVQNLNAQQLCPPDKIKVFRRDLKESTGQR